jgi:DNA-binding beta-propeller fold protein YncE
MAQARLVTIAGGGSGGDGAMATEAKLIEPFAVEFDAAGNLYIAEMQGHRIRVVGRDGRISTVAGTDVAGAAGDGGPAKLAQLNGLHDLRFGPRDGNLYVADTWNARVRMIDMRSGMISTVAGTGMKGFGGDGGPAVDAAMGDAYAIAFNIAGTKMYVADLDNFRVRMMDMVSGIMTTVAGNGQKGLPREGGVAVEEPLLSPRAVAVDGEGNLYIVERGGHAVRQVDVKGRIRTIVGTGAEGYGGDEGPGRAASLRGPKHAMVDRAGDLIIADTENHVIRRYLGAEGRIVHVAGTGTEGGGAEGLNRPHGVYANGEGTLFVADSYNHRVVRVERG